MMITTSSKSLPELRRISEEQITIADLTGVTVQDIQIAKAVFHALKLKEV